MLGYDDEFLKNSCGYITAKEIEQQPRLWKETLEIIKANREVIKEFMDRILSKKDLRIILAGAGTSAFVGDCVYPYIMKVLNKTVESIPTTSIVTHPENYLFRDTPTLFISFARSGDSPESVAAVELAEEIVGELFQIVITCNKEGKLAQKASKGENNLLLLMPRDANDQGFAMTGSYTTMLLTAILIFALNSFEDFERDINYIIELSKKLLIDKLGDLKELARENYSRVIFLGSGTLRGLSKEAFLKNLELTSGVIISNYESPVGFRHGPKTAINKETMVIVFLSNNKYARKYELDLIREISGEKEHKKLVVVSGNDDAEARALADSFIGISKEKFNYRDDVFLAFYYVLFAQILAFYKSMNLKVTPDNPCPKGNANRVVKGVIIYPHREI